jgi:hypothetical protein
MKKTTLFALTSAALLAACSGISPTTGKQDVNIQFAAEINGAPFECGKSYSKIGTTSATITPTDFRMFVSEVHMIDAQGKATPVALKQDSTWQLDNVALIDFENGSGPCSNGTAATNTSLRGTVPAGNYTGVRLTLGVPFERNHGDPTEHHRHVLDLARWLQVCEVRYGFKVLRALRQHGVRISLAHRSA